MKKTYFLVPTRDFSPSGAIALGNLIKSPRSPEFPLNDANSATLQKLSASAITISETDAHRETSSASSLKPTIWAYFLSGIGPGVEFNLDKTKQENLSYIIPRLSTRVINPSLADIGAIFAERQVQDAIRDSRFATNLYLIVGVQIAHGAEYVRSRKRGSGVGANVSADLAAVEAPVTAGLGAEAAKSREEAAHGKVVDDFVFAYSLREVLYRRKKVTEQRQSRVEGDLMGHELSEKSATSRVVEQKFEAEFVGLKDGEDLGESWDWPTQAVADVDGTECQVVHVEEESDEDQE
ncbi:hypothetical protein QBC34DRAFT_404021 [Podospora aff. communis PSN243]|uniref:Uncharacterized protein n=1 Tax=Podospora aff. communis PSN243 TaxID=3040156 RepID=A0AAV9GT47_9PEZI|nr:hypothetical protein QBC34DRAFT_404021 [Podospora aff. communis PSN243]